MALAEVGSGSQRASGTSSGGASADVVFPGDVTAGNLVIVAGGIWNSGSGISAVTPTKKAGSTATIGAVSTILGSTGVSYAGGTGKAFISYALVTGSGSLTMTVATSEGSGNYINARCDEFSGTNIALDVDGGETSGGPSSAPLDGITTLTDNALIIGAAVAESDVTEWTAGSGYTVFGSDITSDIQSYGAEFRVAMAAGAYDVDFFTNSGTRVWSVVSAAFKETAAPTDFELDADAGSYAIAGTDASLVYTADSTYALDADAGEYAVTGAAAVLGHSVPSDFGEYAITGANATLRHGYSMAADAGPYSYVGGAATLQFNGEPQAPAPIGSGAAKKIMPPWFRR